MMTLAEKVLRLLLALTVGDFIRQLAVRCYAVSRAFEAHCSGGCCRCKLYFKTPVSCFSLPKRTVSPLLDYNPLLISSVVLLGMCWLEIKKISAGVEH